MMQLRPESSAMGGGFPLGTDELSPGIYKSRAGTCGKRPGTCKSRAGTCKSPRGTCEKEAGTCKSPAGTCASPVGTCATRQGNRMSRAGTCTKEAGTFMSRAGTCKSHAGTLMSRPGNRMSPGKIQPLTRYPFPPKGRADNAPPGKLVFGLLRRNRLFDAFGLSLLLPARSRPAWRNQAERGGLGRGRAVKDSPAWASVRLDFRPRSVRLPGLCRWRAATATGRREPAGSRWPSGGGGVGLSFSYGIMVVFSWLEPSRGPRFVAAAKVRGRPWEFCRCLFRQGPSNESAKWICTYCRLIIFSIHFAVVRPEDAGGQTRYAEACTSHLQKKLKHSAT